MQGDARLDEFVLSQAAVGRPRACLVATATGDNSAVVAAFYAAFAHRTEATHLALFNRTVADIGAFLLDQDVVYVAGGNTASMLAVWREHGVDEALRAAWASGVVMAGMSAGGLCWFEAGSTDSYGAGLAPIRNGLGILAGSFVPHYESEPLRRPRFHELLASGELRPGYAVDDDAALVFHGTDLVEVVAARSGARARRVELWPSGQVVETELPVRLLDA